MGLVIIGHFFVSSIFRYSLLYSLSLCDSSVRCWGGSLYRRFIVRHFVSSLRCCFADSFIHPSGGSLFGRFNLSSVYSSSLRHVFAELLRGFIRSFVGSLLKRFAVSSFYRLSLRLIVPSLLREFVCSFFVFLLGRVVLSTIKRIHD